MIKEGKYKISVIIPCYNQGQYLEDAVSSILNQTYQNFEIIIINDGSTDDFTNNLLKNYKRSKVRVYHTKNHGLASTRNYGFSLSKGEFIQFLDADDYLDKRKFKEQISIFEFDKSVDICYTNYKYFYDDDKKYVESTVGLELSDNPLEDFMYKWQRGLSIPIHCGLFKKKIFDKKGPFISGFKAIEDWIMWINLAKEGCRFKYLNKEYAIYRVQKNNMTRNKSFMIYWVSRAISYISEHFVDIKDLDTYNLEQENYLQHLIKIFFLDELENKLEKVTREKIKEKEEEIHKILNSKTYKIGEKIMWLPKKVKTDFDRLSSKR